MINKAINYLNKNNFFHTSFLWMIFSPILIAFTFSYNFAKMGVFLYFIKLITLTINMFVLRAIFHSIENIFTNNHSLKNENKNLKLIFASTLFLVIISLFFNNLYLIYNLIIIAAFSLYAYLNKKELSLLIINLGCLLAWAINQDTANILSVFIYIACLLNSLNYVLVKNKYEEVKIDFKKIKIKTNLKKFLLLSYSITSIIIAIIGVIMGTTNMLFISIIIAHILFLLQTKFMYNEKYEKHLFIANQYFALIIFIGILFDKL